MSKYIFITGGVVSSLGKGLTAASLALLLEARGLRVSLLKLDPYLNVDPGTMNPFEHGEVYVTDDGCEADLDLGHYFRFTKAPITRHASATAGLIYESVIKKERQGDFLGSTVQVIPHVTDEIKHRITKALHTQPDADVLIVEIGGTVGDIESLPFLEAIRQFRYEHPKNCINIHLTYVPYLKAAGEVKSKPTQHSVQTLRAIGILPDILLCRSENPLSPEIKDKISLQCSVPREAVIDEIDVSSSIYEVPLSLLKEKLDEKVCHLLDIAASPPKLDSWKEMLNKMKHPLDTIRIGLVGKYVDHKDAYKSVFEALRHAGHARQVEVEIDPIESDKISSESFFKQKGLHHDGYLVPGGFGLRGWMGKLWTAAHCRKEHIPYFGICLGMQAMCVEFARDAAHLPRANSTEMDPNTPDPIISLLSEQNLEMPLGGTLRLGAFPCTLKEASRAHAAYQKKVISERHRHRYEFNRKYEETLEKQGLLFSGHFDGTYPLCEIVEVKEHPWMVGVQFHPEFQSRPTEPHPLFLSFIDACMQQKSSQR